MGRSSAKRIIDDVAKAVRRGQCNQHAPQRRKLICVVFDADESPKGLTVLDHRTNSGRLHCQGCHCVSNNGGLEFFFGIL
jgi:hypothetical protein